MSNTRHAVQTGILLLGLCISSPQSSCAQVAPITRKLDTVVIKAGRIATPYLSLPATVTKVDLTRSNKFISHSDLSEAVSEVPGLFAQDGQNFAQDLRISLRGFGARSAFGIRGIKLIVDGIPETTPDGQGQLDNISVADITGIEVLQGTSGSQYGNAAGGVIEMTTIDYNESIPLSAGIRLGSFGQQEYRLQTSQAINKTKLMISGTHQRTNGYREHSKLVQTNILSKIYHEWYRSKLTFQGSYLTSPTAQDPGGINLDQAILTPRSARDNNIVFDSGESITHWKASIRYEAELEPNLDGYMSLFYSGRSFDGQLPFIIGGAIDLDRTYGGVLSQMTHQKIGTSFINKLSLGYEFLFQEDHRDRFQNLQGTIGDLTFSQVEEFNNFGIFLIDQWSKKKWTIRGSLRYDVHKLDVDDLFIIDGDHSGFRDVNALNHSLGITFSYLPAQAIYANWSTSFETPTLSELSANPSGKGGFNDLLTPMKAATLELGAKGDLENKMTYSISLFHINSTDELIPYEIDDFPGRVFYRNAGSTVRNGIEATMTYTGIKNLNIRAAYSFSNFQFDDYSVDGINLSGKPLPGIPRHSLASSITFQDGKWYSRLSSQYFSSISVTDDDTVSVDPYHIVNFRVGYEWVMQSSSISPFLGINNLFSSDYFDNLRVNAFGGRYYEPAATINWQLGCTIDLNK